MSVRVHFYLLNSANRDASTALYVGPQGHLVTDHPPMIGDSIILSGRTSDPDDENAEIEVSASSFRVLNRRWMPASYGSVSWPHGERQTGHEWLDVMVEPAPEFFT